MRVVCVNDLIMHYKSENISHQFTFKKGEVYHAYWFDKGEHSEWRIHHHDIFFLVMAPTFLYKFFSLKGGAKQ